MHQIMPLLQKMVEAGTSNVYQQYDIFFNKTTSTSNYASHLNADDDISADFSTYKQVKRCQIVKTLECLLSCLQVHISLAKNIVGQNVLMYTEYHKKIPS